MHRRRFLTAAAAWSASALLHAEQDAMREHDRFVRRLRFRFVLNNPSGQPISEPRLRAYGPVGRSSAQNLEGISASVPMNIQIDSAGNTLLDFRLEPLPPHGTRIIHVDASVLMNRRPEPSPGEDAARYLEAEPLVEADHPDIVAVARRIRALGVADLPHAVFEWVARNLDYAGYVAEDLGALSALQTRRGDCTEFAYLFVALSRALGIPARVLGGYVMSVDGAPRAADYHNWAEYYETGAWHAADPQRGVFRATKGWYVAMRVVSTRMQNALGMAHRYAGSAGLRVAMD